jgi:hypothetical protein
MNLTRDCEARKWDPPSNLNAANESRRIISKDPSPSESAASESPYPSSQTIMTAARADFPIPRCQPGRIPTPGGPQWGNRAPDTAAFKSLSLLPSHGGHISASEFARHDATVTVKMISPSRAATVPLSQVQLTDKPVRQNANN